MAKRWVSFRGRGRVFAAVALLATTLVLVATAGPAAAVPFIAGSVAPTPTVFGRSFPAQVTVTNNGTVAGADTLTLVTIIDNASTGFLVNPAVAVPVNVAIGGSVVVPVNVTITGNPGTSARLRLRATATTTAGGTPTDNFQGALFTVTDAVVVSVTAQRRQSPAVVFAPCPAAPPPGCTAAIEDSLRFEVTALNVSDITVTDVQITGDTPPGTMNDGAPPVTNPTTLGPGASAFFTRQVSVNDVLLPDALITFNASATYDTALPAVLNDELTDPATPFMVTVVAPLLTITNVLTDNNGPQLGRGDPVLSTITIDNTGMANANNTVVTVALTNVIPPAASAVLINGVADATRVEVTGNTVRVRIGGSLGVPPAGGTVTPADPPVAITFVSPVVAAPTGLLVTSTAAVSFDNGGVSPKTAIAAPLPILPPPNVSVVISAVPAAPGPVNRGSVITYTITATNAVGADQATNVTISFPIPAQTTLLPGSISASGGNPTSGTNPVQTTFPSVTNAGGPVSLTVGVTVSPMAVQQPGSDIVADATATYGPGGLTADAVDVGHELSVAQLFLTNGMVDLNGGDLVRGEVVDTTVTVDNTNTLTADATNTKVTIALTNLENPGNFRINGGAPGPGQVDLSVPGEVSFNIGTVTPAGTPNVAFNATVVANPTGAPPRALTSASVTFGNGGGSNSPVVAFREIEPNPVVSVTIAANPVVGTPINKDTNVSYVITATNAAGVADATSVQVRFQIPSQTTFVPPATVSAGGSPPVFDAVTRTVSTTFTSIPQGTSATLTVVAHVVPNPTKTPGDFPANDLVGTATVVSYGPGSNPNDVETVAHEISAADLTLDITPATQSIQKAKTANVVVTVGNLGPNPATGIKTVMVNLVNVTGTAKIMTAPGCTLNVGGTLATCQISDPILPNPADNRTITLGVRGEVVGQTILTASLSATGVEIDETPGNNANKAATVNFQQSSANMSITAGPGVALTFGNPTQTVSFMLSVNDPDPPPNNGDPAEQVKVAIDVPPQVRVTAATYSGARTGDCVAVIPAGSGNDFLCDLGGNINDTGVVTFTVTLQGTAPLPIPGAPITATATATNEDPSTPNVAAANITVGPQPVDLSVNDRPANTVIPTTGPNTMVGTQTFPVTVTNNSPTYVAGSYTLTVRPDPMQGVAVLALTSTTPGCATAGNVVTCSGTNLAALATSPDFNIKVDINDPGPFQLRSTVTLAGPTQEDPPATSANNTDTWGVELATADLTLAISTPTPTIQKAKTATVNVTLNNLGVRNATGTKTVTVTRTGDGTILSGPASCNITGGTTAVCTITDPIVPNTPVVLPLLVTHPNPGVAMFQASLAATGLESDENPANNVNVSTSVTFQQSSTNLSVTPSAAVTLVIFTPTQDITFTVANNDPDPAPNDGDAAENVVVTIPIPPEVQATTTNPSCTVAPGPGGDVSCNLGNLAHAASVPITLTLTGNTLLAATNITATATLANNDPAPLNNTASVAVAVIPQPVDLGVNDLAANTVIPTTAPGSTVGTQTFPVIVTNNSPLYTAGSYTLVVEPAPFVAASVVALTSADPGCSTAGNIITCTGTNLGPGAVRTFNIKVDINDPGPFQLRSTVTLTSANQADPGPATNVDVWGVELATADLTLAIAPATRDIQKRKPADVTVTFGNLGKMAATGTKTVTINLTGAGQILPAVPTGCSINPTGTQVVCVITDPTPSGGTVTLPIKVVAPEPGTATITATLVATGLESDENTANNANVTATVNFLQSASDLSIVASGPVVLVFDKPTQNVTFTLTNRDLDPVPNNGDPADKVQVSIPIPAQLRATGASFAGPSPGTCSVPGGSGGTVTCVIGDIADNAIVPITLTLQGTALLAAPAQVTATATATNFDPVPASNTASVAVTVIPQPIDLSVNNVADVTIQTTGPAVTSATRDFTITVTNKAPPLPVPYPTGSYTLTVTGGNPATDLSLAGAGCGPGGANVITCTATDLAPGASKDFVVTATIKVPGPVTITATVALDLPTQLDAVPANNTDSWVVIRNIPPNAVADVGPTVPAGSTLVYDVLNNDTDGDATDIANLVVQPPFVGGAGMAISLEGKKIRVVVPPAEPAATLTVTYTVVDGRGGVTPTSLKVRVVGPTLRTAEGSFGRAPGTARSFGMEIPADRTGDTPTNIDVFEGPLGQDADGNAFSAAPGPAAITYDLESVSLDSLNVRGSTVTKEDGTTRKVARYIPARGYTSDPASSPNPNAIQKAPSDGFTYRTTGTRGAVPVFTVEAQVTAEIKNQSPIGVDNTFDVPNGLTVNVRPALNDLDGNTVQAPIKVKSPDGSFTFDDEGEFAEARGLTIACIGPMPPLDPTTKLPTKTPAEVCAPGAKDAAFRTAGQDLVLETPDSKGKVTVKLVTTTTAQAQAFRTLELTADATVVGELPFVYVVVDNYGGTGFGRAVANVPNTPPQVIEGVRTVLKNTATLVVDTRLATQDANGDAIVVSSVPIKTKEGGTVVIGDSSRTITYTPAKDYLGPDEFTYSVSDGRADGAATASLNLNVVEQPTALPPGSKAAGKGGGGAGGAAGAGGAKGAPAGKLPATGGDPLALTGAAGFSMVLGLALLQASRRRQSRPLLDRARHLRT